MILVAHVAHCSLLEPLPPPQPPTSTLQPPPSACARLLSGYQQGPCISLTGLCRESSEVTFLAEQGAGGHGGNSITHQGEVGTGGVGPGKTVQLLPGTSGLAGTRGI